MFLTYFSASVFSVCYVPDMGQMIPLQEGPRAVAQGLFDCITGTFIH